MGTAHGLGLLCNSDFSKDISEPGDASGCGPGHSCRSSVPIASAPDPVAFEIWRFLIHQNNVPSRSRPPKIATMAMPTLSPVDGPFGVSLPVAGGGDEDAVGRELDRRVVTNMEFIVVATSVCDDTSGEDCVDDNGMSELLVTEPLGAAVEPGSLDWLESAF
jgi:hypothetical protein